MKQYIVDAFTNQPFSGNPAAVCVMNNWPSEESMMKLAMENNLSETAFIVKEAEGYHLRWFTPGTEVELCGHATLASAYVILNFYEPESDVVQFNTLIGILTIRRKSSLYEMYFPTYELREIPVTDAMERAFGIRPIKAVLGLDLVCVFETEEQVRNMTPDRAAAFLRSVLSSKVSYRRRRRGRSGLCRRVSPRRSDLPQIRRARYYGIRLSS